MAKEEIFVIGLNNDQYLRAAKQTNDEILRLNGAQKILTLTNKKGSEEWVENSVALKDNKKQLNSLEKQISNNTAKNKDFNTVRKNTTAELNKEAVTINDLRAQNKKLLDVKNNLNLKNKEQAKLATEIDKKLNKNNETIKENSDAFTQQKLNIGNYGSALNGLSPKLAAFVTGATATVTSLKAQKTALAASSKGLNLFRIALIATGIGAIVVALGLMIGLFLKTQKAVDGLTRFLAPLKEIFSSIIGVLEVLGGDLLEVFSNPKQAITDLGALIKKNITNRIDGLIEIFGILGDVIKEVLSFNFDGAIDATEGLGEALSKTGTGIENLGTKLKNFSDGAGEFISEAIDRGNKIANLGIEAEEQEIKLIGLRAKNLQIIKEQELITKDKSKTDQERNDALDIALSKSKEIETAELSILDIKIEQMKLSQEANDTSREEQKELAELEAERSQAVITNKANELRFIGVANQLQTAAAKEAVKFAKDRLTTAVDDLDLELDLFRELNRAKLEIDGELNTAIVEAKLSTLEIINQKELEALDFKLANGLIKEGEFNLAKLQLENDFQATKKEVLDALSEQQIADRNETLEEERTARAIEFELQLEENALRKATEREIKLEEEALFFEEDMAILTDRLESGEIAEDEFRRRKEIAEQKHANALDKISEDSAKAQAKIEEIKRKQKIEAAANAFGNIAQLLGEETAAGKAAGIAQATINTFLGVAKVWGSTSVLPEPAATIAKGLSTAVVLGSGLAAVKKITAVKAEDGMLVGASHAGGGINIEAEGGEAILNKRSMSDPFLRSLASDINEAGGGVRFQDGGIVGESSINSLISSGSGTLDQINDLVDRKINNIIVTNVATDTTEVAAGVIETENVANL